MNHVTRTIRSSTIGTALAGMLIALVGCMGSPGAENEAESEAEVAVATQALSAAPSAQTPAQRKDDAAQRAVAQLKLAIANLDKLEADVRQVANTQDAVKQLKLHKTRLGDRIREIERDAQSLSE